MESNKNIQKYSIIAGFFVCSIFPFLIFSNNLFIIPLEEIADFGAKGSLAFWGTLFPLFIVFLFWQAGKKISHSLDRSTKYEACAQFTFDISLKIILALFVIYIIGILYNGISVALYSQLYYKILVLLIIISIISIYLIVLTIFSSIIIIKLSLNS